MNPLGCSVLELAKPGTVLVPTVIGAMLKSVLTLPKLAPTFTPAYQPVQLWTGAGNGGGALTAISAAKAGVPINAMAIAIARLFIAAPKNMQNFIIRPAGGLLPFKHSGKVMRQAKLLTTTKARRNAANIARPNHVATRII